MFVALITSAAAHISWQSYFQHPPPLGSCASANHIHAVVVVAAAGDVLKNVTFQQEVSAGPVGLSKSAWVIAVPESYGHTAVKRAGVLCSQMALEKAMPDVVMKL